MFKDIALIVGSVLNRSFFAVAYIFVWINSAWSIAIKATSKKSLSKDSGHRLL